MNFKTSCYCIISHDYANYSIPSHEPLKASRTVCSTLPTMAPIIFRQNEHIIFNRGQTIPISKQYLVYKNPDAHVEVFRAEIPASSHAFPNKDNQAVSSQNLLASRVILTEFIKRLLQLNVSRPLIVAWPIISLVDLTSSEKTCSKSLDCPTTVSFLYLLPLKMRGTNMANSTWSYRLRMVVTLTISCTPKVCPYGFLTASN